MLGLTDEIAVRKFIRISHLILFLSDKLCYSFITVTTWVVGILYFKSNDWFDLIITSNIWMCFTSVCVFILGTTYLYQIVYFQLICLYLRLKLSILNKDIQTLKSGSILNNRRNILVILNRITAVHREIQEINDELWSKFLGALMCSQIGSGNFGVYVFLFVEIPFLVKLAITYSALFALFVFIAILMDVSAIVLQTNKTRKLLLSLLTNHLYKIRTIERIKVLYLLIIFQ